MGADHGAGALAVDVEVADVEFADGTIDLVLRTGVDRAGQAELGVVCNLECVIEVLRLDYGQYRAKDFFLLKLRLGFDVGNDRGLDEIAFASILGQTTAGDQAPVFLAVLDIFEDRLHGAFVDHRAHVRILGWIADCDLLHARLKLLQKLIVDALVNNGARAGRTLLALEAERGLGNTLDGSIKITVGVDDDRVFPTHFEDGALDPELSGNFVGSTFVNVEADFARSGKGDVTRFRMRDHSIAKGCARARAEIDYAIWDAGFFDKFNKLCRDFR